MVQLPSGPSTKEAADAIQLLERWKGIAAKVTVFREGKPIDEATLRKADEDERTVTLE